MARGGAKIQAEDSAQKLEADAPYEQLLRFAAVSLHRCDKLGQSVGVAPFGCSPVMCKLHAFNAGPVLGTRMQVAQNASCSIITVKPLPLQSSVEPQGLGHAAHHVKPCAWDTATRPYRACSLLLLLS